MLIQRFGRTEHRGMKRKPFLINEFVTLVIGEFE